MGEHTLYLKERNFDDSKDLNDKNQQIWWDRVVYIINQLKPGQTSYDTLV